jgi:hypothetical protein
MSTFDVFLSHNSEDKEQVLAIAERLRAEGLEPWVDEWHLVPGATWQNGLAEGVRSVGCTALFIGPGGMGPWHSAEAMLILDQAFRDDSYRLIPVLLPGAPADSGPLFSAFVKLFMWVDLRGGLDDPRAWRKLVAGIRGEAPGPAPHPAEAPRTPPRLTGLDRCLTALGVPGEELGEASRWLAQAVSGDYPREPAPDGTWPPEVRHAVAAFQRELALFVWPEQLLASSFYLSTSKLTRMYRAYRGQLAAECEHNADRFRLLHRYLSAHQRLAFGPSMLLLGEPLPAGDDTWLYFSGDFTIRLGTGLLDAVPSARQIIESGSRDRIYHLAAEVFGPPDPFFLPLIEFEGTLGPYEVTMVVSRKYVGLESLSARALGSALTGDSIPLAGFATLSGRELQPIVCRIGGQEW